MNSASYYNRSRGTTVVVYHERQVILKTVVFCSWIWFWRIYLQHNNVLHRRSCSKHSVLSAFAAVYTGKSTVYQGTFFSGRNTEGKKKVKLTGNLVNRSVNMAPDSALFLRVMKDRRARWKRAVTLSTSTLPMAAPCREETRKCNAHLIQIMHTQVHAHTGTGTRMHTQKHKRIHSHR